MAALMLFLRGVGMAIGGALIWALFVTVPPWLCGFSLCRQNAWWTSADKLHAYVIIKNKRLASALVPEYIGWNSIIRLPVPLIYNRYTMNKYPERLSLVGLFNYIFTILTSLVYWVLVTDFLFLHFFDANWALYAFFTLVAEGVVFFALGNWNTSERRAPSVVITRQGMKQIRAARRVRRRSKKAGKRG